MTEIRKPLKLNLKTGALHQELGVSKDKKIPAKVEEQATHSKNPIERKRAEFAETMKKWSKK